MYISSLVAVNFRSLRNSITKFHSGKNVIVGKNNSGKSNIVKALEILVGERYPSSISFSDNDFYTFEKIDKETGEIKEEIANDFYIHVEISNRDFDEDMINSIKKKTAFSKVDNFKSIFHKNSNSELEINYELLQNLNDIESREEVEKLDGYKKKTDWQTSGQVIENLKKSKRLFLFYTRNRLEEELSGFGLFYLDNDNHCWISHFLPKKLRDALVTTTVVSATRSQKDDLRLVRYSWFGKLIAGIWGQNKTKIDNVYKSTYEDLVKEKSKEIKNFVDIVFQENTVALRDLLKSAIAHKEVSFKFLNDNESELYKNVQIFVNDGIDRPLSEKGTGIQSAVIIALFSQYCNKFHNKSSLLIAEEPELYLHPQARRIISAELNNFLESSIGQERQLIISTHSTEYLKNVDPQNIIRVYKDDDKNSSVTTQLDSNTAKELSNELKRFIWTSNTEIFFADKVILVEGGEIYLIPSIIDRIKKQKQYLDYQNFSIARVNGKGNFITYVKMLEKFKIEWLILGDLDCFEDEIYKIYSFKQLTKFNNELDLIKSKLKDNSTKYSKIKDRVDEISNSYDVQTLKKVFENFASGQIKSDDKDLQAILTHMRLKYKEKKILDSIIDAIGEDRFIELQVYLRQNNIFYWSKGDLESNLTVKAMQISGGKDIRAMELSYILKNDDTEIEKYIVDLKEIEALTNLI